LFTSPIFRRLFFSYLLLMWVVIGALAVFGGLRLRNSYLDSRRQELRDETRLVSQVITEDLRRADWPALDQRVRELGAAINRRITIVDADGKVLADNEADAPKMENHRLRAEIALAATQGDGDSIRHSDTIHTDLLYFAHRYDLRGSGSGNGNGTYFVRLAVHLAQLDRYLYVLYTASAIAAAVAMLAVFAVSFYLARRHAAPLVQLKEFGTALATGNLKSRIIQPPAGEMGQLATSLNTMADSLSALLVQTAKDKAELTAILESMSEGVIAANLKQQVLLVNDAAGKLLGFAPAGVQGKRLWEIIRDPQLLKAAREIQIDPQRRATVQVGPVAGRKLEVALSLFPARGEPEGLVLVAHDVTESSQYQELRKEFVANVSHELRTPLTVIRGFVETLLDGALADPVKGPEYLGTIQKHTEQLANLVSDLLELSKLESQPATQPRLARVDLASVVRKAADLLQPTAARKNQQLTVAVPPALPAVLGNADYLERAVSNLIDNAIKYTRDAGRIRVVAAAENGEVVVEVADNGIGIPAEDLVRVFERFYRVDRSRSREMGGTGLGLSIVKHVAQVHGGTIEVASTPGTGSTFRLKIPAAEE
jgi:two-component system, OmpR family, phosphate regulon sensor histidine kinase PhoR